MSPAGTKNLTLTNGGERHDLMSFTDTGGVSQEHGHGHAFLIDGGRGLVEFPQAGVGHGGGVRCDNPCPGGKGGHLAAPPPRWTVPHHAQRGLSVIRQPDRSEACPAVDENFHARTKHMDMRYYFAHEWSRLPGRRAPSSSSIALLMR